MLPKRGLNIMGCETARLLKLTSTAVEPIPFHVPRKEQSFQADIFPDTYAGVPSMTADEYFAGKNVSGAKKVSLDPAKNGAIAVPSAHTASSTPAVQPRVIAQSSAPTSPTAVIAPASPAAAAAVASASPTSDSAALAAALAQITALNKEVSALKISLSAATGEATGSGSDELVAAKARIAVLEESEGKLKMSEQKLKQAVAALSA